MFSHFYDQPRARGWIHVYAAIVAAVAGATLVSVSWAVGSRRAGLASLIYALTLVAMFSVSAVYHRVRWRSETAYQWMMRLDHAMIFIFIAGTYTPFTLLSLPEATGWILLWIVWSGALAGVILKMCWPSAPRWIGVPPYLLLGWLAAWFIGSIARSLGVAATVLLIAGGVFYSLGAALYALKWPDPWPSTFGHHEFFHACTAIAATCHYIAIWFAIF